VPGSFVRVGVAMGAEITTVLETSDLEDLLFLGGAKVVHLGDEPIGSLLNLLLGSEELVLVISFSCLRSSASHWRPAGCCG